MYIYDPATTSVTVDLGPMWSFFVVVVCYSFLYVLNILIGKLVCSTCIYICVCVRDLNFVANLRSILRSNCYVKQIKCILVHVCISDNSKL